MRSPLRYPGGKSKALKQILPLIPQCEEFREPFVGGAGVSLAVADREPQPQIWINDLNEDLIAFWGQMQAKPSKLISEIQYVKDSYSCGKHVYKLAKEWQADSAMHKAIRFFILNRVTYSGLLDSGGYSQQAFEKRFTQSSIDRLLDLDLFGFKITHGDYEPVMLTPGDGVFLFLDPPYYRQRRSKLYGKNGDLHTGFDHARFAEVCRKCPHRFLITLDDSPEIWNLFEWANIKRWDLQYSMGNCGKSGKADRGSELFITNY